MMMMMMMMIGALTTYLSPKQTAVHIFYLLYLKLYVPLYIIPALNAIFILNILIHCEPKKHTKMFFSYKVYTS